MRAASITRASLRRQCCTAHCIDLPQDRPCEDIWNSKCQADHGTALLASWKGTQQSQWTSGYRESVLDGLVEYPLADADLQQQQANWPSHQHRRLSLTGTRIVAPALHTISTSKMRRWGAGWQGSALCGQQERELTSTCGVWTQYQGVC